MFKISNVMLTNILRDGSVGTFRDVDESLEIR